MEKKWLALLKAILVLTVEASAEDFKGWKLMSVELEQNKRENYRRDIEAKGGMVLYPEHINRGRDFQVLVPPNFVMEGTGENMTDLQVDVAEAVKNIRKAICPDDSTVFNDTAYNTVNTIYAWIENLSKEYFDILKLERFSLKTVEGREILLIKISKDIHSEKISQKPIIFIETGIHAREWLAQHATWYAMRKFLEDYTSSDESAPAKKLLEMYELRIIPLVNPDGVTYSMETNLLWRKNRNKPAECGACTINTCTGVDLNRNFPVEWAHLTGNNVCDAQIYSGPAPGSEIETQNVMKAVFEAGDRLIGHFSIHGYSQVILLPWSHCENSSDCFVANKKEMDYFAHQMSIAMQSVRQEKYEYGIAQDLIQYAAPGTTSDWALLAQPQLLMSATVEVFPRGTAANCWGDSTCFQPLPSNIVPTGEEMYEAIRSFMEEYLKRNKATTFKPTTKMTTDKPSSGGKDSPKTIKPKVQTTTNLTGVMEN